MYLDKEMKKDNRGFTLLELIVTVVILALVVAPFLSSFATASKTNVRSKRIQEANELSQYIIEQFKATTIEQLVTSYKLSEDTDYQIDATTTGYKKKTSSYSGSMSSALTDAALPTGFSDEYKADITLKPIKSIVNGDDAIPVIDDLDKTSCAVLVQNIYKYDASFTGAVRRRVVVTIDYDAMAPDITRPYSVTLAVTYYDATSSMGTKTTTWYYANVPSVYILYKPLTGSDTILVDNNLTEIQRTSIGADGVRRVSKVNVYLINQNSMIAPAATAVQIKEVDPSAMSGKTAYFLNTLVDETNSNTLKNTILYTNIATGADKDDVVNGNIKTVKIDTLYELNVTISYAGEEISKYTATKTTDN